MTRRSFLQGFAAAVAAIPSISLLAPAIRAADKPEPAVEPTPAPHRLGKPRWREVRAEVFRVITRPHAYVLHSRVWLEQPLVPGDRSTQLYQHELYFQGEYGSVMHERPELLAAQLERIVHEYGLQLDGKAAPGWRDALARVLAQAAMQRTPFPQHAAVTRNARVI